MNKIYMLLLLLISLHSQAQTETEPNNSFETANNVNENAIKSGTVNNTDDKSDYFIAILPTDGTLKIYVNGTNTSASSGYLYMYGYDRRKGTGQIFGEYIKSSSIPAGGIISDTITAKGRASDTVYFRFSSSVAFSYDFTYEMTDTSANDMEPNNTFAESISIDEFEEKKGHIGYLSNGTSDVYDYYRTVLPKDGTLKVYVKGTNTSASSGYLYMYGYDRRQATGQIFKDYIKSSSVPAGTTITDTLIIKGRAADTVYFSLTSSVPFSYSFSYEITDTSTNDIEPNNNFEQSVSIAHQQEKKGHIGYISNGVDDASDYYRTILPFDGTLKILVNGTNRSSSNGYLYLFGYDKRKEGGKLLGTYISGSSSIKKDSTIYDTISLYGLLADTFYFRIQSSVAFNYSLKYEMSLNGPIDDEPNNTFEEAVAVKQGVLKSGQVGHQIGGVVDSYDYFRAILPTDGTLKIYVNGTNTSASSGYLYMYGYDRRKGTGQIFGEYIKSSSIPAGGIISDTITAKGRASDTVYFRFSSSVAFSYDFTYEMTDTSANDMEPNNTFAESIGIDELEEKKGHIGYLSNGTSDAYDYYRTVLPKDGTLKVYVKGTNTSASSGYLYMYGYDRRQEKGQIFKDYIKSSSVPVGTTITDTLIIKGRAADTVYFSLTSSVPFSYSFSYEITDTSTNDIEPNNTFEEPIEIAHLEEKKGHIGYVSNGTSDTYDYYRTVLPKDGTLKVYVKGTNTSASSGYLYMYGYDRRQSKGQIFKDYIKSSSVPAGTTITDTLIIKGRAADTVYFSLTSSVPFSYSFSYEITDTSTNDIEPNNTFEEPIEIAHLEEKQGHIGYVSNGTSDLYDYYRAVLPTDGTLKVFVRGTNTSASSGYLYMYGFDRRKGGGQIFSKYIKTSSAPAGTSVADTIIVTCRAADTVYFRVQSSQSFNYSLSYTVVDTSLNDVELNNTISTATETKLDSTYNGHIGYVNNGTTDANDYYYTVLPSKGKVQIITEVLNTSGGNGFVYLYGYKNSTQTVFTEYIGGTSSLAAGSVTKDTITINCATSDTLFLRWTSSGCFSYSFQVSHEDVQPIAAIGYNVGGSLHEFTNLSTNAMSYTWDLGDSTTSTNIAPELKSYSAGSYLVKLISKNTACNFTDTASLRLTVNGLDRYTPKAGGPGNIEFIAYGGGFHQGMQVLLKQGAKVYKDSLSFVNEHGNIFSAIIDMHSAPQGVYDVEVITNDTTYFFPGGYISEALVDKLKTEIIGRDIIRMNSDMPYSVRVNNEGNTIAGLVEVYVLFPSYMNVQVLDSMAKIVNHQFDDVNLDTVPLFRKVTKARGYPMDGHLYSFYIAGIPAGGFRDLSFTVNSSVGKDKIYAWVKGPASGSEYKPWFDPCNEAKLKMVLDALFDGLSILPIVDCAANIARAAGGLLYSAANWVIGNGAPSTASLTKTTWGVVKNCAGEALAAAGFAPGVAAEIADVLGDIAILGSNIDLNAAIVKDKCSEEPKDEEEKPVDVRRSLDPNAKSGPAGYTTDNFINGAQRLMNYTIFFENQPTATLPAQEVIVTDTLDKNLFDLSSFRALSYSIGANKYHIPGGAFDFIDDVPFNAELKVRMSVKIDTTTGVMKVHFKTIDKATGDLTTDPLAGFLPPNTTTPEGEGHISFAINLKEGLDDGTVIRNKSSIIFDNNEPIITNEWVNTLDRNKPSSKVSSAYQLNDSAIVVRTTGSDISSGVRNFELYVSMDGKAYEYAGNMGDSAIYPGETDHTYSFYAIGIDSVRNIENKVPVAEATVKLGQTLAITLGTISATNEGRRNRIDWNTLHEDMGDKFEVEKSIDGTNFTQLTSLPATGSPSSYIVYDDQPAEGRNFYRLKTYDFSGSFKISRIVSAFVIKNNGFALEVFPNPVKDRLKIYIHGRVDVKANISISNLMGSIVAQANISGSQTEIDLSNQPAGTYIIRYTDNHTTEIIKIVKQ